MKPTEESPEIYRYPFDDKNPDNSMVKYYDSYKCVIPCANCGYRDEFRIKYGVTKRGLTHKCYNCKVCQEL
jgi:hypothetical protein